MACNNTARPLLLFPNPAHNHFILQVNNTERVKFINSGTGCSGKLVYEKRETKPAAIAVYAIPAYQLGQRQIFYNGV